MGKTSFSGPAYGAKATLFSGVYNASTGSSFAFAGTVVPAGEDWYATEVALYRGSTGSSALSVLVHDDSTLVGTVTAGGSTIAFGAIAVITKTEGEYEGKQIAAGSLVTFTHSSHAGPNEGMAVTLSGFRRFINSTRAE